MEERCRQRYSNWTILTIIREESQQIDLERGVGATFDLQIQGEQHRVKIEDWAERHRIFTRVEAEGTQIEHHPQVHQAAVIFLPSFHMHSPYPPSSPSTTPISNHQNRPICYPWPFPSSIKQDQRSVNCLHRSDERDEYHHCLNFILYTHPPPPTFKRPRPRLPSPPSHFLPPPGYLNG